jgi:hypothetical protein
VEQAEFYSGRKRRHTIKYEIGVHPESGHIVWIAGGVGGRTHDITLTRQSGLLESLESNELILGDLGYLGEYQILTPHKRPKTSEQQTENNVINKKKVIVENVIKRFKDFHALSTKWRHSLEHHKTVFLISVRL